MLILTDQFRLWSEFLNSCTLIIDHWVRANIDTTLRLKEHFLLVSSQLWCHLSCRFSQKQRPCPPEVLLPAHQDPDIHPLHRRVHLCQRQGHRPGLFWRLCGEGDYMQSARLLLFCFPSSTGCFFLKDEPFVSHWFIGKITFVHWETKEA